jgi:asparagine synthase (glutamine-hydrolysing)
MCGIAGLWSFGGGDDAALRDSAARMASTLLHRGPDAGGLWCDAQAGVAFGFRRLKIIDLSDAGAQPMVSRSGRYVIVFNGEIYNFQRLRKELDGPWRGHSDTEVLLAAIQRWGIDGALERFIGMFAFAVWDAQERRLTLAIDRLGVKPLYYALDARGLAFASELGALPPAAIDRGALALYMRYGYVPAPWSIFENVRKLEPGRVLTIDASGGSAMRTYWDAPRVAERAASQRFRGSERDALDALETLLADAVRLRMIADVPLGVFLSGGIDSPLVTALMQREAGAVSTFSLGIPEMGDEAPRAAAIAKHLGTHHTEAYVDARDVLDLVPRMAEVCSEPLGDSSTIPALLVSAMARKSVTVALSGDGGDELFGGYHRYFLGARLADRVARVPRPLRGASGRALRIASHAPRSRNLADRMRGLGDALVLDDPLERFLREMSDDRLPVRGASPRAHALMNRDEWPRLDDPIEQMMVLDAMSFLPGDVLTKVDRASMHVSLEVREPLLDHRVAEFAWSLPRELKVRGEGKWILRALLRRFLPDELVDREKHGFGLPIDAWLRGPLREWAAALLDPARIASDGWFEPAAVRALWRDEPRAGAEAMLWRLLMFQQWLDARTIARA